MKRWAASVVRCAEHVQGCATQHGLWLGRGASRPVKTTDVFLDGKKKEEDNEDNIAQKIAINILWK